MPRITASDRAQGRVRIPRRAVLRASAATAATAVAASLPGCGSRLAGTRLTLGTGFSQGVYYTLGGALADAWQNRLELAQRPVVRPTAGSVDNLTLLGAGSVDVIFATADVADAALAAPSAPGRMPRALARIYDDALQVVVPADSPITRLADLRGHRVSLGAADSGVLVAAKRLLEAAGLSPGNDLQASLLGLDESVAALRDGRIEAFFWTGGLPTVGLTALAKVRPIRLLDLAEVATAVRHRYPVYDVGTVTAGTYGIPAPVTALLVRNFLLVAAQMPDELAGGLVEAMFDERERLVRANPAGRAIDTRSAIGTQPVPLHPGAERYYRELKDYD
ncbi:TAXI family TRAP transporter solute-binding subunit [Pseudonocardia acaciae]|uniref:TAXI family TRAP transporter solute-binding subunit n=1 Tax=Pseudonocardia acaciae TaxID=551276 RepID=UPI000688EECD|nr:TAXI family TRAP transporter solute-binding subunit [Pseudonocardia acaciae]